MYFKSTRVYVAVYLLLLIPVLLLTRSVVLRHTSNSSNRLPIIFQGELERSGIKNGDYIVDVPTVSDDDVPDNREVKVTITQENEYSNLILSLMENNEVIWHEIVAKYLHGIMYDIAVSKDYIVIDLFDRSIEEKTGFQEITLLPQKANSLDLYSKSSVTKVSPWAGRDQWKDHIASILFDMHGSVLDYSPAYRGKESDKCIMVKDVELCDDHKCIEIGPRIYDASSAQDTTIEVDITGRRNVLSSTGYLELVGLYNLDCENILVILLFQDDLFYRDSHLYTWQPPLDIFGVNPITERCMAIFLMDANFDITWDAYLGPVHFGSDSSAAFAHLTMEKNLFIVLSYRYDIEFVQGRDGARKTFNLDTPSGFGPNVYQAIACIALTGEINYVSQMAKGFLWTHNLLKISDDQFYLQAHSGNSLTFASDYLGSVSIPENKSFSCVLKLIQ